MRPMHKVIRVDGAGRHSGHRVRLWGPNWDPDVDPQIAWRRALSLPDDAGERDIVAAGSLEGWHLPNAVPVQLSAAAYRNADGSIRPPSPTAVPDGQIETLDESSAALSIWVRARCTTYLYGSWFSPVLPTGGLIQQVVVVLPPHWRLRCTPTP